jgi:O-antigen/teichoic acid export membrane protein
MVNYSSKLLKGAGIIFAASILSSAFAYFIRILLAKKLSVEEFGLFFAVYSAVLTVGAIKGLGTGASVSKFIPEFEVSNEQNKIKSVLSFIFLFNIFSSIVVFIIFYFFPENIINSYFKSEMAKSLLLWLFVFVSIDSLSKVVSGYFLSRHFSFIFSLRDLIVRAVIFLSLLLVVDLNNIMVALMHIGASLLGFI